MFKCTLRICLMILSNDFKCTKWRKKLVIWLSGFMQIMLSSGSHVHQLCWFHLIRIYPSCLINKSKKKEVKWIFGLDHIFRMLWSLLLNQPDLSLFENRRSKTVSFIVSWFLTFKSPTLVRLDDFEVGWKMQLETKENQIGLRYSCQDIRQKFQTNGSNHNNLTSSLMNKSWSQQCFCKRVSIDQSQNSNRKRIQLTRVKKLETLVFWDT